MKKSFRRLTAAVIAFTMIGTSMPANVGYQSIIDRITVSADAADSIGTLTTITRDGVEYQVYELTGTNISLDKDYTLDHCIYVPQGKLLQLKLNGYKLDRGLSNALEGKVDGCVIWNEGALFIEGKGTADDIITGGYAVNGGGINNAASGILNVEKVNITGNKASGNGGGIMNSGNATQNGGISKCNITGNHADGDGGGIYNNKDLLLVDTPVKGNSAGGNGGAIYQNGTFRIKNDNPESNFKFEIMDNTGGGVPNNIYLPANKKITLAGSINDQTKLYVYAETPLAQITEGWGTYGPTNQIYDPNVIFKSDQGGYAANQSGEVVFTGVYPFTANSWSQLQAVINSSYDSDRGKYEPRMISLISDITAGATDSVIDIPSGSDITINLCGHTLNRNLATAQANGGVFHVNSDAKLSLNNFGSTKNAYIKGGNTTGKGGAIFNEGTLNVSGIIISQNAAASGGGIYTERDAVSTVSGGTIIQNNSAPDGGGIYNIGSLVLNNANIDNNTAVYGGGIVNDGTLSAENSTVSDNSATDAGGGIYNNDQLTLNNCRIENNTAAVGGGIKNDSTLSVESITVSGNSATSYAGGIYQGGTFNVKGRITINGNTTGSAASNVYLPDGYKITLNGKLTNPDDTDIGITMEDSTQVATSGWNTYNGGNAAKYYFTSDDPSKFAAKNAEENEVVVGVYYLERFEDGSQSYRAVPVVTEITGSTAELTSGYYYVSGNVTNNNRLTVGNNQNVKIILKDGATLTCTKGINVKPSTDGSSNQGRLTIYGQDADSGKLVATADKYNAAIGGNDEEANGYIEIVGGTIEVTGGDYGAGIGTGDEPDEDGFTSQIKIYGGTVTANGGEDAAGIGGGNEGNGAKTFIYGGTVTAKGGLDGAGIGGGDKKGSFGVEISGGTVNAYGRKYGSGIGSGDDAEGNSNYTIKITGGTVNAEGLARGAGIGGEGVVKVVITGGKVYAKGKNGGAGIGGIYAHNAKCSITISGGYVEATGGDQAAGIGGGSYYVGGGDFRGSITITGGEVIAKGTGGTKIVADYTGSSGDNGHEYEANFGGAGIGGGYDGDMTGTISISGGTVTAYGGAGGDGIGSGAAALVTGAISITGGNLTVAHGKDAYFVGVGKKGTLLLGNNMRVSRDAFHEVFTKEEREDQLKMHSWNGRPEDYQITITECDHKYNNGSGLTYAVNDSTHTASCKWCKTSFTPQAHTKDSNNHCTVCGYQGQLYSVSFDSNNGSGTMQQVNVVPDSDYILPECGFTAPLNQLFKGWEVNSLLKNVSDVIIVNANTVVKAVWEKLLDDYTAPTAKEDLEYTGEPIQLVNAGSVNSEQGTIYYTKSVNDRYVDKLIEGDNRAVTADELTVNTVLKPTGDTGLSFPLDWSIIYKEIKYSKWSEQNVDRPIIMHTNNEGKSIYLNATKSSGENGHWQLVFVSQFVDSFIITDVSVVDKTITIADWKYDTENTWSTSIPTATDAGSYKVWYKVDAADGYKGIAPISVTATIAHKITAVARREATCTEAGYEAYWQDETGQKYSDEAGTVPIETAVPIPIKDHTPADAVRENEVPATNVADGSYDEVVYCSECGAEISRTPHIIPKLEKICVDSYKSGNTWTAPTRDGMVFAGWFSDSAFTTPYMGTTGYAYAKFIDAKCITVKWQKRLDNTDKTDIRLVSTLDNGNYDSLHFVLTFTGSDHVIKDGQITHLYDSLNGYVKGKNISYAPGCFCTDSKYFAAYTVTGMPNNLYDTSLTAQVYITTLDGTTVYGKPLTFKVSEDKSNN